MDILQHFDPNTQEADEATGTPDPEYTPEAEGPLLTDEVPPQQQKLSETPANNMTPEHHHLFGMPRTLLVLGMLGSYMAMGGAHESSPTCT